MQIAERAKLIPPSETLAIAATAKRLRAQGIDVCDFSVGEPDFVTPSPMREAAKAALDRGETKYSPVAGLPELREAVAAKLSRENALSYQPNQVLITTGGKQALFNTMLALLNPGDEVLIPAPYWVTYPEIARIAGAMPVFLPTEAETGFKLTPEQLEGSITPRTRLLILNSPCNPTGTVYSREELLVLARVIVARQLPVISDEIYEKLIYDHLSHSSLGSLDNDILGLTITCNGFSKAYAATGWRLGYVAGPETLIRAATAIQSHSTSGPNTFAQYGALAALTGGQAEIEAMRRIFEHRRNLMADGVSAIPGLSCARPQGAFYVFPSIAELGVDSTAFCQRLLEEEHVAAVPGKAFGADAHIRLSYATDSSTIEKGLERIGRFVSSLRGLV